MSVCHVMDKKSGRVAQTDLATALATAKGANGYAWVDLFQPTTEELETLATELHVHELTIEDLQNSNVRSKIEEFEDHLFVVFKAFSPAEGEDPLDVVNLNLLLFKSLLVSVHLKPVRAVGEFEEEIRKRPAVLQRGSAFVLYRLIDSVVDDYFPVLEELDEAADDIQTRLFEKFDPGVSSRIFELKTRILHLNRRLAPQREILTNLANRPEPLIPPKVQVYFRDVYDHVIRIHENLENYRDVIQGAMDSYMTLVSYRMNQVMKILSVVATIMLPLSLLAGIYGTNFGVLPGANHPYGFWVFLGILAVVGVCNAWYFKKKHWF